ncbi:PQ loop repeat protein [Entamoeba marina]
MICTPVAPYLPFIVSKNKKQTFESFNIAACYVLLSSNVFRIGFYIGNPFELSLLIQSFVLIATMLILLYFMSNHTNKVDFNNILLIFGGASITVLLFSYFVKDYNIIVQSIGTLSTTVEVFLAIPQIIYNYKNKNAEGLPLLTLVGWVLGDTFKTVYFVSLQVPIQFIMCGVFQLICDAVIFAQIAIYSPHVFMKKKVELPHDSFTFPKKR